jgi:hypothetical protein
LGTAVFVSVVQPVISLSVWWSPAINGTMNVHFNCIN